MSQIEFGRRLKKARQAVGLNGPELASKVGVEKSVIPQYETGRSFPSVPVLQRLALVLGVTLDSLLFDDYSARDEIRDKELAEYFRKADELPHRERSLLKDFVDSLLARVRLEKLESRSRQAA